MKRPPVIRAFLGNEPVVVDNFAGGGGVSEAFLRALGRSPDHAINHDPEALAMHEANHPETQHHCGNVWDYKPRDLIGGRRCAAAWFSPDCKDHSSAKGGKPVDKKIRALAWVAVRWAKAVHPDVIFLENVPEFRDWGPVIEIDGEWKRDPKRKGQTFRRFVRRLQTYYRHVEWRILRACDYGSPTRRKRLFLIASDRPIVWPQPTHGPLLKPYRTAAECIDFGNLGASIFMTREEARTYKRATGIQVKRPLAAKTLERIAAGVKRHVIDAARPFIIPVSYGDKGERRPRTHSIDEPFPTVTADRRGDHALVSPVLIQTGQGEREGQRPRYLDIQEPLGTVVACGQRHAMAAALLAPFVANNYSVREGGGWNIGHGADEPMATVTAQRQKALVAAHLVPYHGGRERSAELDAPLSTQDTSNRFALVATHLVKFAGTSSAHLASCASGMQEPVPTITAGGWKVAQVAAFLIRYNRTGRTQSLEDPIGCLDTNDRFAVVTVVVAGVRYVIADILMRMLEPRELFRAQGVRDSYIIDPVFDGEPLDRTAQIRMCGNMVPPHPAEALIRANVPLRADAGRAA